MVRRLYFFSERIQWTRARTATTIGGGELDLDHLIGSIVDGRSPTDAAMSFRANCLLAFPIDDELAGINALLRVGLPLHIATGRTNHFDPILRLPADQNGCRDIACIEQMLAGGEVRLLKIGMDRFGHGLIGGGCSGCSHMRDEMRGILLTGFGEMHFIARPPRLALCAIACFWIIGRGDELVALRKILIAAPVDLALDPDVVLDPDAAQDLDGRDLTQT